MNRISREMAMMQTAEVWARRSTCMRRNVGAIIVVDKNIVSIGYNGAPPGEPHCDGLTCVPPGEPGCTRALHAEYNAIERLDPKFLRVSKVMYTTESPCIACATLIVNHHFSALYYLHEYRVDTGIKQLLKARMQVYRMTPGGMLIRKHLTDNQLTETLDVGTR